MTACLITGCDKTAAVYAKDTEHTGPMCADCYGYLSTLGLVEFVGSIRSEGRPPVPLWVDADTSPERPSAWLNRPLSPWWILVVVVAGIVALWVEGWIV